VLKASWIIPSYKFSKACPLFRKDFSVEKEISEATLYITAKGVYEATLNGQRVGNFIMAPGWTSYHNRIQVQRYDVKPLLKKGKNSAMQTAIPGEASGSIL
jgi:alpha-L-rhamnosidase